MPATRTKTPDAARSESSAERIGPQMRAFASNGRWSGPEMIAAPLRWPRPARLREPLELPAGKLADGMRTLGLKTVGDLLEHLPRDSREARTVSALRPGEQATVAVQVRAIGARPVRRRGMRPLVEATVLDATGSMRATFFNQPWLVQRYPPGTRLLLHGKADERGGFRVSPPCGRPAARARRPAARPAGRGRPETGRAGRRGRPGRRGNAGRRALPGRRGRHLDADPHARAGRPRAPGRCGGAAARGHARGRATARPGERAGGDALPRSARDTEQGRSGWPSRSCCC